MTLKLLNQLQQRKLNEIFIDFFVVLSNTYKLTEAQIRNMSGFITEGGT